MNPPTIIGIVFIAVGLLVAFLAFRARSKAQSAQTWPMVPGHVVKSWVGTRRRKKGMTHYYIGVEYAYRVADKDYTARRISFTGAPMFNSQSTAQSTANSKYPEGMNLNVYYNPQNHAEAILDKKVSSLFAGLLVGMIFATIGGIVISGKF
jgi:hypothetical protein